MRRRRFLAVVLGVFVLVYFYLGWSLFWPLPLIPRAAGYFALFCIDAAILWLPLVYWRQDRELTGSFERALQWAVFSGMGLLSFILVLSIARDLLSACGVHGLRTPTATLGVLEAAALLFVLGALNARFRVRVKRTEIPLPGLAGHSLRVVQISDLHVGPTIRRPFVEKIVALAQSCEPDLIVLTGDIVDGTVADLALQLHPLSRLSAPLGKFYVPGNHEYYWEAEPWIKHFKAIGFVTLVNENRVIGRGSERFVIAGVGDPAGAEMGGGELGPDFARASAGAPADARPWIVLCHQPKLAPEAASAGFDLQLSGHTHGGQFFPWTLAAKWIHAFPHGLHQAGAMKLYVSRGTGYWGPPVRLGASAEVSLLILTGTS